MLSLWSDSVIRPVVIDSSPLQSKVRAQNLLTCIKDFTSYLCPYFKVWKVEHVAIPTACLHCSAGRGWRWQWPFFAAVSVDGRCDAGGLLEKQNGTLDHSP